jgi:hypothetical protein
LPKPDTDRHTYSNDPTALGYSHGYLHRSAGYSYAHRNGNSHGNGNGGRPDTNPGN